MKILLTLCIAVLLTGCAPCQPLCRQHPVGDMHRMRGVLRPPPYHNLNVTGNFIVKLTSSKSHDIKVSSIRPLISLLQARVSSGTLYLSQSAHSGCLSNEPIVVEVPTQHLNTIYFQGNGCLRGDHLCGAPLTLELFGNLNAKLTGIIPLKHLTASIKGNIDIVGIHVPCLTVVAGDTAHICLQGCTNHLEATVSDCACVRAKYLSAFDAHIHTQDESSIEVNVCHNLNAFADNYSSIYYYTTPKFLYPYMRSAGSIIDMMGCQRCCSLR